MTTTFRLSLIAGASALALSIATIAHAQDRSFDIPAQPLSQALLEFSKQSNVVVTAPFPLVKDKQAKAVKGDMSPEQALARLLEGSRLQASKGDDGAIVIEAVSRVARTRQSAAAPAQEVAQTRPTQTAQVGSASISQSETWAGGIEEVIVTAQKRSERLIDVPVSISLLSAQDIENRGLVGRADYMRTVPSLLLREDGAGLAEIVIRGAYADRFNSGPTVGLYFADVPLTGYALGGSTDIKLIDIARVEVLRGPQGSLYGSNALSGAVRYIPAAPELRDFAGKVNAEYSRTGGNGGDNTAISGVFNAPLIEDRLAVRAVAFRHGNEGYVKNIAGDDAAFQAAAAAVGASHLAINKDHVGNSRSTGGRVSALWKPVDVLSLNVTYFKQKDAQDDRLFELQQYGPYRRADYQFGDVIGGNDDALVVDVDILNVTGDIDLGWGNLYSSTAWLDQVFVRKWDVGSILGRPTTPVPQINRTDADVFTQEIRFTSQFEGPIGLVAGLFYEDSATPSEQSTHFGGNPARNPFPSTLLWRTVLDRQVEQKAAFGEISYDILDNLELTVGGRAFKYESRFMTRISETSIPTLVPNSFSDLSTEESGETAKAGLEFKPTEDAMVYATWSQGFRLGQPLTSDLLRAACDLNRDGFLDGTSISSTRDRIDSDRLDSYELGGKVGLMNGRGNLQAAVFQNDWTDVPVRFTAPGCPQATTVNGGTARARGLEAEGMFRLTQALRLNFGFGYVNSELTATTVLGTKGDRMNFTPKFNGNLGLEYDFAIFEKAAFIRSDFTYFGAYYTGTGERGLRAAPYGLVNLRAGLELAERARVHVRVDNVLNSDAKTAVLGPSSFPPGYGVRLAPRTIGVGLAYDF